MSTCPNCKCPTASKKIKAIGGNSVKNKDEGKKGYEERWYCGNCGWLS